MRPLCFVLMPFGKKSASNGRWIDFDAIYEKIIKPAIEAAELTPLRADEEIVGGVIHKAMYERLSLCEYAVADLSAANANVFYELGVRHAVRPWATQLLFAEGWASLPFDVDLLRALPYRLDKNGAPSDAAQDAAALTAKLQAARHGATDSPIYQMLEGFPDIQHRKTDVFREQVKYAEGIKRQLADARKSGVAAIAAIETQLGDIARVEAAIVVDLFLSYRAVKAWDRMIALAERMSPPLAATVTVREQLALAQNRAGRGDAAETTLLDLIAQRGGSSETYGILGRVYKDRWEAAAKAGDKDLAQGLLDKAIVAYLKGFEADWRDAYPGVNAVTLMELNAQPDPRQAKLLPVVAYAVEQRISQGQPDYWDYATLLELAVLARAETDAKDTLGKALAHIRESWEAETTARNLRLIRESRAARGETLDWANAIENALNR